MAVGSVVIHRWHFPWIAAALLALGSIGGFVVYEHGVGVKTTAAQPGQPTARAQVERD